MADAPNVEGVLDRFIFDGIEPVVVPDDGQAKVKDHVQVLMGRSLNFKALHGLLEGAHVDVHLLPNPVLAEDFFVLQTLYQLFGANFHEA